MKIKIKDQSKNPSIIENFPQEETNIFQQTDIGQAIIEINKDELQEGKFSGMDMRARLHPIEISNILALDSLVALKFLPVKCLSFTRSKKRLSVSIEGKGRSDIIKIISGDGDRQAKTSGLRKMFGMGGTP